MGLGIGGLGYDEETRSVLVDAMDKSEARIGDVVVGVVAEMPGEGIDKGAGVTDSAVRRLINDAGEDLEDLMTLCEADITSKNREKVKRLLTNFAIVREKIADLNVRDEIRKLQPPVDGNEIMEIFGISGGPIVGTIKSALKNAILDGIIAPNDREAALELMYKIAADNGLTPVK